MEQWYRPLNLDLPAEQFQRLPRHPAYEYGWWDGQGHLQPCPKLYHCRLPIDRTIDAASLASRCAAAGVRLRPVSEQDWPSLTDLFDAAFRDLVPFCTLPADERHHAVYESLQHTRRGDDGPLVAEASGAAVCGNDLLGAILITLIPAASLEDFSAPHWTAAAPHDALNRHWGRPHITWVFVSPRVARRGIGSLLLQYAVASLGKLGYGELASTFCPGNVASLLWHWRNGFELLSWPGSHHEQARFDPFGN